MKSKHPQNMYFECPLTIEAAADDTSVPRFSMVAYTGGLMKVAWFSHPVVVDLEGIAIERQNIPIRLEHNPRQGVGHTDRVVIENGQILAEGLISRDTTWARDVAKSGSRGFPWQASIGADILEAQFIPNGSTVVVNGRSFDGPLYVIRRSVLKEISFVDNAADGGTVATVAAAQEETLISEKDTSMDEKNKEKSTETPVKEESPKTPETIQAKAPDVVDPVAQMRQRVADETLRIGSIQQLCGGKHPDIEARAIAEGWDATRCELEVLRASRPTAPAAHVKSQPNDPKILRPLP
jgi:hypothetical protein